MRREHTDPYVVLGVPRQASASEIARAYRRAARATHPDSGAGRSGEGFRAVRDAYETLSDPQRRAAYDRSHPPVRANHPVAPEVGRRTWRDPWTAPFIRAGHVEIVPPGPTLRPHQHLVDDPALLLARFLLSLSRRGW
jgi:hypothetical protein